MGQNIVIRGTARSGIVLVLPGGLDFQELCQSLWSRLSQAGRFFRGAQVTIHTSRAPLSDAEQETIVSILSQFDMRLSQVLSAPDPITEARAALKAERTTHYSLPAASLLQESETALVVTRTLRSGQGIRHQGDVIVLGDVNPGAEIVASGHIVVMGALRGVAHAGASGNEAAFVAAAKLRPTQLRIAHVIGRAPDSPDSAVPVPEVARVRDGMIVVETPAESKRQ